MSKPQYKLSTTLVGHQEDVRGVRFISPNTILSCSRDTTVRKWAREASTEENQYPNNFSDVIISNAQAFVNAVAFMPPFEDHPQDELWYLTNKEEPGLVISGGQDAIIEVRAPETEKEDADYLLLGHAGNVCSLDVFEKTIISGSWDQTAIVWKNWEKQYSLEGHQAAVWAVLAMSDDDFITGCADKKIRWFKGEKQIRSIEAHSEPVRGLCKLPHGGFASCSNDGTIRTWTIDGNQVDVIYGHTAFIYSIAALPSGEMISSGEDRTVRVWKGSACLQTITHPAISVWSVAICAETGDIVSGASDRMVRVFSRDKNRWADEDTLQSFDEAVAGSAIPEQQVGEVNKEKLPGPEALHRPGKHDGETIMINAGANVEAYSWSSAETTWTQIGVVTGAVGSSKKTTFEGKDYDYVFDVDFEEGKPPLKLPYNVTQNPFDAARIFLERNELPLSYLETTANFIVSNSSGHSIGRSAESAAADPYGIESRYRPGDADNAYSSLPAPPPKPKVLPQKSFLDIATANYQAISKKILDTNKGLLEKGEKEASLNFEDVEALKTLIQFLEKPSAPTSTSARSSKAVINGLDIIIKIINLWTTTKLPGFDLLRLLSRYSPAVPLYGGEDTNIIQVLELGNGFDKDTPNNVMLTARAFLNMFHTPEGLHFVDKHYEIINKHLHPAVVGTTNRNLQIAYITLLLNYAVQFNKIHEQNRSVDLIERIVETLSQASDAEAVYRALVAIGTATQAHGRTKQSVKENGKILTVVREAIKKADAKEKRIKDVGNEILEYCGEDVEMST